MVSDGTVAAAAVDGGALTFAGGLLALVRPALDRLAPGGVLAVLSAAPELSQDLPAWCRLEHHRYLGRETVGDRDRHLIAAGTLATPQPPERTSDPLPAARPLTTAAALAALPLPAQASAATGFAPRGVAVEPGGPPYPFTLLARDHVAPPETALLYDQAVANQWDAARDIAWEECPSLDPAVEAAVAQVMTFLAENELAALYVPARFLPRLHPAYVEVALFLASQLADEARHIDAFLKRARLRGGAPPPVSAAFTAHSLRGLLESEDFTEATFLLSVLGEGTFLDLLRFIETQAPDPITADVARRARADEARHVHFGLAHVRHALAHDPTCATRLEAAVRRRAAGLDAGAGVPARVQDALTILAAGSTEPAAVGRGHAAFRALLETMHEGRMKRLEHAGFTTAQAEVLSALHTPNFM